MARPGLTGHRKFRRLERALGSAIIARGALELLWEGSYESGEEYIGTSDDIEHLVGWQGDRGALTRALVDAGAPEGHGFIEVVGTSDDGTQSEAEARYRIHDLWHHAPDYVMKRRRRELDRQQKVAPDTSRRAARSPNGGQRTPTPASLNGVVRPPSPSPSPSPSPVSASSASRPTAADVVELWNGLVTSPIPKVTKVTADRRAKIGLRLMTFPELEDWRRVITWINQQAWCRAPGSGDHPNWTATLDWLCKNDGNVQRCLERAATERDVSAPPAVDLERLWATILTVGEFTPDEIARWVGRLSPMSERRDTLLVHAPNLAFRDALPAPVEARLRSAIDVVLPGRRLEFMWVRKATA